MINKIKNNTITNKPFEKTYRALPISKINKNITMSKNDMSKNSIKVFIYYKDS
jgi:hypothetical protein